MNEHGCIPVSFIKTVAAGFGLWTIVCQSLDQTFRRGVRIHEKVLSSGLIIDLCFGKFALISVLRIDLRGQYWIREIIKETCSYMSSILYFPL